MDLYMVLLAIFGAIVLLTAWTPMLLEELPLSLPIVCIAIGMALASSPLHTVLAVNPLESREATERLTEFVVIVSLMGAGLKLHRPPGFRRWGATWRLLGISMPLTIAAITLIGWGFLGLGLPAALLLGAALAPTDPVLASDVQVGPPRSGADDETRFALTSEAGLNDGLAFPFVYLAIAMAGVQATGEPFLADWLRHDVVWKLSVGALAGWLGGRAVGWLMFRLPDRARISRTGDGFVALGITGLVYGGTELLDGYGFLAVFVAGVSVRAMERRHAYHEKLHEFAEQIERLLMMALLVFFGAAIAEGSIFGALDWRVVVASLAILFLVRPLSGWIGLIGHPAPAEARAATAFFGIRGLGSFYYLAYALGEAEFERPGALWVTVCCVVLLSIVLHGTTVTPVMRRLDGRRARNPARATPPPATRAASRARRDETAP
ncbi:cation:proton antiporter [Salinarimonas sp.]|uniref:cation:proton antiporter n=1 Tax=Salinarimonas sp. TaxID=2766526 RepID=UPI0032D99D2A